MFKSSFRGASVPLFLASAGLGLALVGCGGGSGTNLPAPGSGQGGLGTAGGGGGGNGGAQVDNNTIVFVSTRDGNPEIYSINANGTGIKRLTNDPGVDERPSRSVDGRNIVFSSNRDGNFEIYKMNADGSSLVRLTSDAVGSDAPTDTNPVFSRDGNKIVWQSTRAAVVGGPPVRRLYTMDASGANQRPVVLDDANQPSFDGTYNPDNSRLLGFLVNPNDNANNDLAVITPGDGTTPATSNIIRAGTRSAHARYSSAGARIVLSDGITGVGQLQLLDGGTGNFIGNGPTGGVDQSNPSFNPTGSRLVWDARPVASEPRQLYVADVTATGNQPAGRAITTQGDNYQASWTQ